ncbi:MAG: hypothetical protein HOO19_10240 [Rhodospirillaceae bacterium]|nr:hypothetical protein [Rhodospirillaceae bacterium]MBT3883415.1 hypothetical protein [Rhodospirillaceae bacterium]MBT4116834.1 hypothetical protein [Rhodospirillaceae bacterium]MBT4670937.1 hypothetical protein [Rhodospirillaceae bacterium]MBT4718708.1 hypothetical protein [Rhodospirillaceae bacterium]
MRTFIALTAAAMLALAPALAFAAEKMEKSTLDAVTDGAKKAADATVEVVKEHPGKSTGVVACGVVVAFFPPALLLCGGALVAGTGVDVVADQDD